MKLRIFTPGDLVCRKGEVAREMYVIIDGKIEVIGYDDFIRLFLASLKIDKGSKVIPFLLNL